ncbi:hypothetical protein Mal15_37930 [Stieleria maiorica]|uniref:Uncharacterized protein n=1 Tax=Stieleria maiorica TaxID=2795974 RepID=A0A5B9MLC4_9BACT|nr:hypothetical protein [Stieleria maiorica]QEF99727.1 hypothetical protein Mal15_37930 [Stieleria maiorica]
MRDRSNIVDLVLAFAATFVITLALWPRDAPRQIVRCNTADQGWKTYSIAINDPSLDDLKQKLRRWATPESHPAYVTAKWQKEVAEFYENSQPAAAEAKPIPRPVKRASRSPMTATISDTVTTASYETELEVPKQAVQMAAYVQPVTSPVDAPAEQPTASATATATKPADDSTYWSTVKASAVASMELVEARTASAPIVFDTVTPASWPQLAFHFAFLFGIAAACGYMHWLALAPLLKNTSFDQQPGGVLARIGTFSGVIALAMISAIAVWI